MLPENDDRPGTTEEIEHGTVVEVNHGVAFIRVRPSQECSACQLKGHCHDTEDQHPILRWPAPKGLVAGQRVIIRKTATSRLKLTSMVYGIPLVTLLAGALAGNAYGGDAGAIAGCVAGLAIGAAAVFVAGRAGTRKGTWTLAIEPVANVQDSIEPLA